jgi:hypothetical protein
MQSSGRAASDQDFGKRFAVALEAGRAVNWDMHNVFLGITFIGVVVLVFTSLLALQRIIG